MAAVILLILTFLLMLQKTQTKQITLENYEKLITPEKLSILLFYSPWQNECKPVIPIFEDLEKSFVDRDDIFIGTVDSYRDLKLASKFHIEEYCSVKYILKGSNVAESRIRCVIPLNIVRFFKDTRNDLSKKSFTANELRQKSYRVSWPNGFKFCHDSDLVRAPRSYEGKVDQTSLYDFIEESSRVQISENIFKTSLINLNEETFNRIVKDSSKTALVLFYAVWCKKCESLLKTMKRVAYTFKSNPDCIISQINGEQDYSISILERVGVYPTFKFYSKSNKDGEVYLPGKYDENWSEKNITKFMNVHCRSDHTNENLVFDKMAGLIDELDIQARNFLQHTNVNKRQSILRETVLKIQNLQPYKRHSADYYVQVMRSVLNEGPYFIRKEIEELDTRLLGHVEQIKKEELERKRNILQSFKYHVKDEL